MVADLVHELADGIRPLSSPPNVHSMVQKLLVPEQAANIRQLAVERIFVVAGKVPPNYIFQPLQPSTLVDLEHDVVFVLAKLATVGYFMMADGDICSSFRLISRTMADLSIFDVERGNPFSTTWMRISSRESR